MATIPSIPSIPSSIQLPGSIISDAKKAANAAQGAIEAATPSFDDLMNAAKGAVNATAASLTSGAAGLFKDVSDTIASVGAAQFGMDGDYPDTRGFEAYKKQIADVQKNSLIDMAIAKAGLAQKALEATAAGVAVGAGAIADALGATKALQNLQANLTNPAQLAADAAATEAAKAETIAALKANTMLAMLSKPMPPGLAGAVGGSLNPAMVNNLTKLNIIKAQETAATQEPPGQAPPVDSVRPKHFAPDGKIDYVEQAKIARQEMDKRVFKIEVYNYGQKTDAAKTAYLAYFGITWKTDDPEIPKDVRTKKLDDKVGETYDQVVGRAGANQDRFTAKTIKDTKPNEADRTEEEKALIKQVSADKEIWYKGDWWKQFLVLQTEYSRLLENYKLVYNAWINNGDRFKLPVGVEKELKS
jgi:hypothetical protein